MSCVGLTFQANIQSLAPYLAKTDQIIAKFGSLDLALRAAQLRSKFCLCNGSILIVAANFLDDNGGDEISESLLGRNFDEKVRLLTLLTSCLSFY